MAVRVSASTNSLPTRGANKQPPEESFAIAHPHEKPRSAMIPVARMLETCGSVTKTHDGHERLFKKAPAPPSKVKHVIGRARRQSHHTWPGKEHVVAHAKHTKTGARPLSAMTGCLTGSSPKNTREQHDCHARANSSGTSGTSATETHKNHACHDDFDGDDGKTKGGIGSILRCWTQFLNTDRRQPRQRSARTYSQ